MIQKVTAAVKNMAQRAMMRGDIGQAEAIDSLGMNAAKNILRSNAKPLSSNTNSASTGVHEVFVEENIRGVKKDLQTGGHVQNSNQSQSQNKNLGSSILDALK